MLFETNSNLILIFQIRRKKPEHQVMVKVFYEVPKKEMLYINNMLYINYNLKGKKAYFAYNRK